MSMSLPLLKDIHANFEQELLLASKRHKTSLAFILNTIPSSPLVKNGETFQVLAVGGSMYRNAMVKKTDGELKILQEITDHQPSFIMEEDFLTFIDSQLDSNTIMLALNFAYPLEPVFKNGKLDGKLINGTKENTFLG